MTTKINWSPTLHELDTFEIVFIKAWRDVSNEAHYCAVKSGFWGESRNEGEQIALMHSELSEVLEGLRKGNPPDKHLPEFSSAEVEYADLIIRVMDNAAERGYRLAEAIIAKTEYNRSRPYKHGKQF